MGERRQVGALQPDLARLALQAMWRRDVDGWKRGQQMDLATWVTTGMCTKRITIWQEQLEILLDLNVCLLLLKLVWFSFDIVHAPPQRVTYGQNYPNMPIKTKLPLPLSFPPLPQHMYSLLSLANVIFIFSKLAGPADLHIWACLSLFTLQTHTAGHLTCSNLRKWVCTELGSNDLLNKASQ